MHCLYTLIGNTAINRPKYLGNCYGPISNMPRIIWSCNLHSACQRSPQDLVRAQLRLNASSLSAIIEISSAGASLGRFCSSSPLWKEVGAALSPDTFLYSPQPKWRLSSARSSNNCQAAHSMSPSFAPISTPHERRFKNLAKRMTFIVFAVISCAAGM